jgi:hypothetical protein
MKSIHLRNKFGGAALASFLLLSVGIGMSTTVHGQDVYRDRQDSRDRDRQDRRDRDRDRNDNYDRRGRNWDRYGTYGGSFRLRQTALNAGYNEGIKVGRKDRSRRRESNYQDNSAYRKADKDYSSGLGDKELYRRYYREGYENGYGDGRRGY